MDKPVPTSEEINYARDLRHWRERREMTKQALATEMRYDASRIGHIEALRQRPNDDFTRHAERVLQTGGVLWERWEAIAARRHGVAGRVTERDLRTIEFVAWLADHSTYSFPSLYAGVCDMIAKASAEPPSRRHGREYARRLVSRGSIAHTIRDYYGSSGTFYTANVDGADVPLGILTREQWLDVTVPLGTTAEQVRYTPPPAWDYQIDDVAVAAAVERLADAELDGTVMVNNPLYRLLDVDLRPADIQATVTTVPFAEHAMTSELMERELLAAIATSTDDLPLRDRHLPSVAAAFDLAGRACVGGPTTLLAVARTRNDGEKDYALFAQERSNSVLNLAGKLAVVPKGFHQPTGEASDEAALSATLWREFEEELLGREDLEQVSGHRHDQVDLLHPQNLTAPAAWLMERPDAWRLECTGLGFNLLTANYECACLIVIEDDTWWNQFGHLVVTNWEAERVYRYSSVDTDSLRALIQDPRWGNESLFAFLQGLRRLAQSGDPARLSLPNIELEA